MKAAYKFFPEEGVVAYKVVGRTGPMELKDLFEEIGANEAFSNQLMGISDLREVDFRIDIPEVLKLARYVRNEVAENCPWITLVSGPVVTAVSVLFRKNVADRYQVYIYSTEEKASNQLGKDVKLFLDALAEVPLLTNGERKLRAQGDEPSL